MSREFFAVYTLLLRIDSQPISASTKLLIIQSRAFADFEYSHQIKFVHFFLLRSTIIVYCLPHALQVIITGMTLETQWTVMIHSLCSYSTTRSGLTLSAGPSTLTMTAATDGSILLRAHSR